MSIYVYTGKPGAGKTYHVTRKAIEIMKSGKRNVVTNYPIIFRHKGKILSSYKWEPEHLYDIAECEIFLDEAWQYFSSRNFKNFTVDEQKAFAENRHNGNNFHLVVQHHSRLDVIIREIMSEIVHITNLHIGKMPLLFFINRFQSETEFDKFQETKNSNYRYGKSIELRSRAVEKAYDTRFYKNASGNIILQTWEGYYEMENQEFPNMLWDYPKLQAELDYYNEMGYGKIDIIGTVKKWISPLVTIKRY